MDRIGLAMANAELGATLDYADGPLGGQPIHLAAPNGNGHGPGGYRDPQAR